MSKEQIRVRAATFPTAGSPVAWPQAPSGELPEIAIPPVVTAESGNGFRISCVPFGIVPKVTLAVVVRAGRVDEQDRPWLSLLAAELLKHGTISKGAEDIAACVREMGGTLSVRVGDDETRVCLNVLSEHAAAAAALLCEIVSSPALQEAEFLSVQKNMVRDLGVRRSYQGAVAGAALTSALYPSHPYGNAFPTAQQLESYVVRDVRNHHGENFCARRAQMYIVGQFDQAAIEQAVHRGLSAWHAGAWSAPSSAAPGPRVVRLIDRPGSRQSSIRLGTRLPGPAHPDFTAVSVVEALLAGMLTSRITMNLREKRGWTYSPASHVTPHFREAQWTHCLEVRTDVTGPALQEIFREIELLHREPPNAAELEIAKHHLYGEFVTSNAKRDGLISTLALMSLHGLSEAWLSSTAQRLGAVTPEQVSAVARRYFSPAAISVVVAGDLAMLRAQLQEVRQVRDAAQ